MADYHEILRLYSSRNSQRSIALTFQSSRDTVTSVILDIICKYQAFFVLGKKCLMFADWSLREENMLCIADAQMRHHRLR